MLARAAYQTQCDLAKAVAARTSTSGTAPPERQTVFGVDRAKLMVSVSALAKPAAGKKTLRFREGTAAKRAEKQAADTWCGWGSAAPKPRLGGAAAVKAATKSAATAAVRARLWLSGKARRQNAARTPREHRSAGASTSSSSAGASATAKVQVAQSCQVPVPGQWLH